MSLLEDIYGDDSRTVLEAALDQATPNRISRAWVCHRIEEVIGQLSTLQDDGPIEGIVQACERKDSI
tara:strand:- start:13 stop:213 length:201 start_codon:yes stop_codon:yes gene_type:complete